MTSAETKGTVVVTGANSGLGSAFVERLLPSEPSNQYGIFTVGGLTAQSSSKLEKLLSSSNFPHSIVPLDLTSLSAVREFAEHISSRVSTGHVPENPSTSVECGMANIRRKDTLCERWNINYLLNFVLVLLLLKGMDTETGSTVFVSSFTHNTSHYMNSAFRL